jgi:hypothetical protein
LWIDYYASVWTSKNLEWPPKVINATLDVLRVFQRFKNCFRARTRSLKSVPRGSVDAMLGISGDRGTVLSNDSTLWGPKTFLLRRRLDPALLCLRFDARPHFSGNTFG